MGEADLSSQSRHAGYVESGNAENSAEAVHAHLDLVLNSGAFAGAWRQRRLLQYLVEESLQGRVGNLKEYSVGVEVFEKGEDFDPRLSPIVRVEASRLRKRLKEYYETPGHDDQARIELPKGSYVPRIAVGAAAAVAESSVSGDQEARAWPSTNEATPAPLGWPLQLMLAAGVVGIAIAVSFVPVQGGSAKESAYSFSRVTREPARCSSPSLSRDGRLLAYARREGGDSDIFVRRLGSEDARSLTSGSSADELQPAFSPDGRQIAYRSERDGGGIYVVGVDGAGERKVAGFGYHPSWSPDGKELVFSSKTFETPEDGPRRRGGMLYRVDVQSGAVRQITSQATVHDAVQPAWSPNGKRIAFWGSDERGNRDLWTVEASAGAGGEARATAVTRDQWIDWNPVWSPDGRQLYYVSDRDGSMNLWRLRLDEETGTVKGEPEPLRTPAAYSAEIAVARDGKRIAYVNRQISSMVYSAPLNVAKGVDVKSAKAVTSAGERFREPLMSPDGEWLAVRIQDPQEDIGLMRPDGKLVKRLTSDRFRDRSPRWAPDGSHLYFLSNRGGTFEYWVIRPDGSGLKKLSNAVPAAWWPNGSLVGFDRDSKPFVIAPEGRKLDPSNLPDRFIAEAWSPDGKRVVGRGPTEGGQPAPAVYTASDGSAWRFAETSICPVWLDDHSRFLFQRAGEILLADVEAQRTRVIASFPSRVLHERFTLSRDQRLIYFVLGDVNESIWLAELN